MRVNYGARNAGLGWPAPGAIHQIRESSLFQRQAALLHDVGNRSLYVDVVKNLAGPQRATGDQ